MILFSEFLKGEGGGASEPATTAHPKVSSKRYSMPDQNVKINTQCQSQTARKPYPPWQQIVCSS